MKRPGLAFLVIVLVSILVTPLVAEAKPTGKIYRIGYLGGFGVEEELRQDTSRVRTS